MATRNGRKRKRRRRKTGSDGKFSAQQLTPDSRNASADRPRPASNIWRPHLDHNSLSSGLLGVLSSSASILQGDARNFNIFLYAHPDQVSSAPAIHNMAGFSEADVFRTRCNDNPADPINKNQLFTTCLESRQAKIWIDDSLYTTCLESRQAKSWIDEGLKVPGRIAATFVEPTPPATTVPLGLSDGGEPSETIISEFSTAEHMSWTIPLSNAESTDQFPRRKRQAYLISSPSQRRSPPTQRFYRTQRISAIPTYFNNTDAGVTNKKFRQFMETRDISGSESEEDSTNEDDNESNTGAVLSTEIPSPVPIAERQIALPVANQVLDTNRYRYYPDQLPQEVSLTKDMRSRIESNVVTTRETQSGDSTMLYNSKAMTADASSVEPVDSPREYNISTRSSPLGNGQHEWDALVDTDMVTHDAMDQECHDDISDVAKDAASRCDVESEQSHPSSGSSDLWGDNRQSERPGPYVRADEALRVEAAVTEQIQLPQDVCRTRRRMTGLTSKHFSPAKRNVVDASDLRHGPAVLSQPNQYNQTIGNAAETTANSATRSQSSLVPIHPPYDSASKVPEDVYLLEAVHSDSGGGSGLWKKEGSICTPAKRKRRPTRKVSEHFTPFGKMRKELQDHVDQRVSIPSPRRIAGVSYAPTPSIYETKFGLIQERLWNEPFWLIIAVKFLNRSTGRAAVPIFWQLREMYPTPSALAEADRKSITAMIHPLGFQNERAKALVQIAEAWVERPPERGVRFRTLNYPNTGDGKKYKRTQMIEDDVESCAGALEVAHIPYCGPYAWDSWRIFCRDVLRGVAEDYNGRGADDGFEPEWQRVLPMDKELRVCLMWMWLREGWIWNFHTGEKRRATAVEMEQAIKGEVETDMSDPSLANGLPTADCTPHELKSSEGEAPGVSSRAEGRVKAVKTPNTDTALMAEGSYSNAEGFEMQVDLPIKRSTYQVQHDGSNHKLREPKAARLTVRREDGDAGPQTPEHTRQPSRRNTVGEYTMQTRSATRLLNARLTPYVSERTR